jgi:hypothetical protein
MDIKNINFFVFSGSCACVQLRFYFRRYGVVYLYTVSHIEIWKVEEYFNDLADLARPAYQD